MQSQADLAKVLVETLDRQTLTAVLSQLLGARELPPPPPPTAPIRSREFRRQLGNLSHGQWHRMRQARLIPDGTKLTPKIEIWTPAQVLETIARLAAAQRAREERDGADRP
jgi:hypothetical protein